MTGFKDDMGSWKIIAMLVPQNLCLDKPAISSPINLAEPSSIVLLSVNRPINPLFKTVLPEPDSPTMAIV